MKILWCTNTPCSSAEKLSLGLNRGGWLISLEKELSIQKDIELHVVFYHTKELVPFNYNNTWFYPIKRRYNSTKFQRYFARLLKLQNNDKIEIKQLNSIVEQIKPDLIHVHGTEENFGLIQYYTNIPVVISIQGILSSIVEKFFSGIPADIAKKHNSTKSKISAKSAKSEFYSYKEKSIRERDILKISKNIIGRTDWDKRVTALLAPNSTYYLGQEILRPSFYMYSWKKKEFNQKIRIVTTINNGVYKGFETILKSANILSTIQKYDFEWLLIGSDRESEIVTLVIKWLKVSPEKLNIKLLGNKNELEVIELLLTSDIYCQVSHIENSPNSLCEAMILGLPCIATFVGGTSSILENNKEGVLVQDGDPFALAGAIFEVSNNFDKAKEYGNKAQKKALLRHNTKQITSDLVQTYNSIIQKNIFNV